jgi:hypothetical protein
MSVHPDDNENDDVDWWKKNPGRKSEPPGRPHRILFIGGPYSGRRIEVPVLSEGELIRLENGEFLYYVQDKPHSVHYYFQRLMTAYFNEHREVVEEKFGGKITPKNFCDKPIRGEK